MWINNQPLPSTVTGRGLVPARNSSLPASLRFTPALLLPLALIGPNEWLALYALAVLTVGVSQLWRPGEPPVLLFVFLYQWIQAATGPLYGNAIGAPIAELTPWAGRHDFAVGLMLTGTLILSFAMRIGAGRPINNLHANITLVMNARPFGFWLRIYVGAWVLGVACAALAPRAGGLQHLFLSLSEIKWAAFTLLTIAAFTGKNSTGRTIWLLVFAFEFLLSIGGFFASFKQVFLYALFGLAASNVRFSRRSLLAGASLGIVLVFLSLAWTAIKDDYRSFVNSGTGQQIVTVGYSERIREIGSLVGQLDGSKLQLAMHALLGRLMYHHFFGAAAANVPHVIAYTGGEIWGEAVARPFMPRILFPAKRPIEDSELTNQYTGLGVATAEQGTSISLGYMAEAYIDFGPILMFAAIAALGVGLGRVYRWLLRQKGPLVAIGAALAPFALMSAHLAETSILKMASTLILSALACLVVLRLISPVLLGRTTTR